VTSSGRGSPRFVFIDLASPPGSDGGSSQMVVRYSAASFTLPHSLSWVSWNMEVGSENREAVSEPQTSVRGDAVAGRN